MERINNVVDNIFLKNGKSDNKHILNTCSKVIEQSFLDKIEKQGITSEQIIEMTNKGIDIYKYQTQITIHGIFPELINNYLYSYKYLFQNKNKSIGIKYNAIDIEKKLKIAKYSSISGWAKYHNSSEFSIFKQKRIDNNEQYQSVLIEYNDIANRINKDLFFGRIYIYTGNAFGSIYLVINIELNAILDMNMNALIEQINNEQIDILTEKIREKDELQRIEKEKREKEWELLKQQREKEQRELIERISNFVANNKLEGYEKLQNIEVKKGIMYATPLESDWKYFIISKIGKNHFTAECNSLGVKTGQNKILYGKYIKGYIKTSTI